jgi:hypothetical protein
VYCRLFAKSPFKIDVLFLAATKRRTNLLHYSAKFIQDTIKIFLIGHRKALANNFFKSLVYPQRAKSPIGRPEQSSICRPIIIVGQVMCLH